MSIFDIQNKTKTKIKKIHVGIKWLSWPFCLRVVDNNNILK
jgi:hypothetical protein